MRRGGTPMLSASRFWLGLQSDYDLEEARKIIAKDLSLIERIAA
jgi:plasmid maintenance system antidote protein VapI